MECSLFFLELAINYVNMLTIQRDQGQNQLYQAIKQHDFTALKEIVNLNGDTILEQQLNTGTCISELGGQYPLECAKSNNCSHEIQKLLIPNRAKLLSNALRSTVPDFSKPLTYVTKQLIALQDLNIDAIIHLMVNKVTQLYFTACGLLGQVDFTSFPQSFTKLNFARNQLSGNVKLTMLPPCLESLSLTHNRFSGNVDLTSLPKSLKQLRLSNNRFDGTIDLTRLPPWLEMLDLSHNNFEGHVNLTSLPKSLQILNLKFNQLTGKIHAQTLSQLNTTVMLEGNHIWIDSTDIAPGFFQQQLISIYKHELQTKNNSKKTLQVKFADLNYGGNNTQ